jgi:rfaE bifunctional protein kinase chain/domain
MNLASLGARAAIVGVVGDDAAGHALLEKLNSAGVDCGGVLIAPKLRTTTKQRVFAGHSHSPRQQVIRLDYENEPRSDASVIEEIVRNVRERFDKADAVVVSDYNYGVAGKETLDTLLALAANGSKPLLVDSRYRLKEFAGFTSATPNEDEVENVAGRRLTNADELETEAVRLRERLGYDALLVTRGKHGMLLVERDAEPQHIEAVGSHDAVDVTGAGDTVIATFALALASGSGYSDAARLANHAGGIVVLKRGTACVYPHELLASLHQEGE